MLMSPRKKAIFNFQDENSTLSGMFSHFDEDRHFCTGCPDWKHMKNGVANKQTLLVKRQAAPVIHFSSPYTPLLLPTKIKLS